MEINGYLLLKLATFLHLSGLVTTYFKILSSFLFPSCLQIFKDFDPVPIASASLAQVHVAHDHDGKKLAVKVSYFIAVNTISSVFS